MKTNPIVLVIGAVVIAAAAFFGGMKYQQSQVPATGGNRQFPGASGRGGGRFGNGANRPVSGSIISVDDKSMTVKLQDGSSKIVLLGSATINKAEPGTATDLKTGVTVAVFGTTNTDGSVTAQNIQLNPTMRFPGGSPAGSAAPAM